MSILFSFPHQRAVDNSGAPIPEAKMFFYENLTSTPKSVFSDANLNIPHTNPVVSDAFGQFPVIGLDEASGSYTVKLTNSINVTQPGYPVDDIGSGVFSQAQLAAILNPKSDSEFNVGVIPTEYKYPNDEAGVVYAERFGAKGDDDTDDYDAINWALLVCADAGGGEVRIQTGKIYRIGTSLIIPEKVRLRATGAHAQPNEIAAVIKPLNTVSIGIDNSGANVRGLAVENITVDMSLMPVGAKGILYSGVHQFELKKIGVFNLPDPTAIGIHLRGDAASGFGTLYGRLADINISNPTGSENGTALKLETVSGERANAILMENMRLARCNTGAIFDGTGSGILGLNFNSESNTGDGIICVNTQSGTCVSILSGEINGNGGWGVNGSTAPDPVSGRIVLDKGVVMGSNTAGDINTSRLDIGGRILATATGPTIEHDGVHIKTDKSFIGGSTSQTVVASDTITCGSLKNRLTAASAITMSSNPQIADGSGNQLLILIGTSDTNTITIVDGQGLRLNRDALLRNADSIALVYDSGGTNDWVEVGRSIQSHAASVLGFYGTTPIAKQTGVAVTAGGIHAALVALGIFAA